MCSSLFRVTQAKLAIFLHPCKQFSKKMQKRAGKPGARGISAPPAQRRATPRGPSAQSEGQGGRAAARLPPRHRTHSERGGGALPRRAAGGGAGAPQLGFRLATESTATAGAGRFRAARLPQAPRQASRLQPPNRTAAGASLRRALAAPGGRRWVGSPRSGRRGGRAVGRDAAALPEGGEDAI